MNDYSLLFLQSKLLALIEFILDTAQKKLEMTRALIIEK